MDGEGWGNQKFIVLILLYKIESLCYNVIQINITQTKIEYQRNLHDTSFTGIKSKDHSDRSAWHPTEWSYISYYKQEGDWYGKYSEIHWIWAEHRSCSTCSFHTFIIVTSMTMKQNGFIIDVTSIEELFNITIWNF